MTETPPCPFCGDPPDVSRGVIHISCGGTIPAKVSTCGKCEYRRFDPIRPEDGLSSEPAVEHEDS